MTAIDDPVVLQILIARGNSVLKESATEQLTECNKRLELRSLMDDTIPAPLTIEVDPELDSLVAKLEKFDQWLQQYEPDIYDSLNPGISREQIDKLLDPVGLAIPEEVYALYQWHDGQNGGIAELVPGFDFLPLWQMVNDYNMSRDVLEDEGWNKYWLPVFHIGRDSLLAIAHEENPVRTPIYSYGLEDGTLYLWTENLEAMVDTLYDCYKAQLMGIEALKKKEYIDLDSKEIELVRRGYNPNAYPFSKRRGHAKISTWHDDEEMPDSWVR
jgi:hypothetical protein